MRAPIGIQIRRQRKATGQSQANLAKAVGISASYLNLIESNKRAIGGALLLRIAERLNLDVEHLSGRSEQRLIQGLQEIATDPVLRRVDLNGMETADFVARYPEAARAIHVLYQAYCDASEDMEAYASRLRSDPFLSETLHEVLNRIAAMRSSAEILFSMPDLDVADRNRFTGMIHGEGGNLTHTVRNLAAYFDESTARRKAITPLQEVEEAIIAWDNYYPRLEEAAGALRREIEIYGEFSETTLTIALDKKLNIQCRKWTEKQNANWGHWFDAETNTLWFRGSTTAATRQFQLASLYAAKLAYEIIRQQVDLFELTTPEAHSLAQHALSSYIAGAIVMPYEAFFSDAEAHFYDIDLLSQLYSCSFEQVAHRLVTLRRKGQEGVPFGFLRTDTAGRLSKRFPLPGFTLPVSGHGCLLWPIYDAFASNGALRQISEFTNGNKYLLIAKAVPKRVSAFGERPLVFSVMLACDILHADRTIYGKGLELHAKPVPIGPSCRLCIRYDCGHRQEPASAQ
ncbi:helix-turn-helix domain-containing protein [Brucellaceae bacterium C25G]